MRVGFYQFRPIFGQVARNRRKVIEKLSRAEADLVVLPELPFTGYYFTDKEEALSLAEPLSNSPTLWELAEVCARKNLHVVTGFAERVEDRVYNSALLIGPQGLIHTYRKIHLFDREKLIFTPGDTPLAVQEIEGVRIGMMVCFDWAFPEVARTLALLGAQIICHPSNLVLSYCQQAMLTRCLENQVFAITANRFGEEKRPHGTIKFTGKSQVVAPRGKLIFRAASRREVLYITEIDPTEADNKQLTVRNHLFGDRRPEFYRSLCEEANGS